jgi:peptidoglycan/LPS O-acetylase OafA/YrhL
VVLFHLQAWLLVESGPHVPRPAEGSGLAWLVGRGDRGVPLFFVVSGFVLALPFAQSRAPSTKGFYLRRLTRLEPPFVVTLLALFVLFPLASRHAGGQGYAELLPHLLANLAYSHTFVYRGVSSIAPIAWSLEIELQFYLLAPLLGLVFRAASPRPLLAGGVLAFAALHAFLVGDAAWLRLTLLGQGHFFLTGVLACALFVARPAPRGRGWDLLGLAGGAACVLWPEDSPLEALLCLPMALLLLAALWGPGLRRGLGGAWVATVGGMCYSIYLWHFTLISAACRRSQAVVGPDYATTLLLQALMVLPAVLLFCAGFFLLVERPCMDRDWPRRLVAALSRRKSVRSSS